MQGELFLVCLLMNFTTSRLAFLSVTFVGFLLKHFLRWTTKINLTLSSIRQIAVLTILHAGPKRIHLMYVKTYFSS